MNNINSCLFVGEHGLFEVYCVFSVLCINDVRQIKQGDIKGVEVVTSTDDGCLVYLIEGKYYYHHHFILLYY